MGLIPRRLQLCAAALALLCVACARAESFELERVQKADVKVLPGESGFTNPLTGIVSYTPQDWQERAVLGIKVGNSGAERPQSGLDRADVVYEELVEGGVTRFLAIFLTNQAPRVGPVRSVRTVDHKIMQPTGGLFGYSGGVPPVVSELHETPGVTDVGADRVSSAYVRDSNRQMPYNLYTSTDPLWSGRTGSPPSPQFDFLTTADDPATGGDEVANEIKMTFAGNSGEVRYLFNKDTGAYDRYNGETAHMVEGNGDGMHLAFRNVIVQSVAVGQGDTIDRAGAHSLDISMIGGGGAVVFRAGQAIRGTWQRSSVGEPTKFVDDSGGPLRLAPGKTIIVLLPKGREMFVS